MVQMSSVPPVGSFNRAPHITQGVGWETLTQAASPEATAPRRLLPRGFSALTFSSAGFAGYTGTGAAETERMVAAEWQGGRERTALAWVACTKGLQQRQVYQAVPPVEAKLQESGSELADSRRLSQADSQAAEIRRRTSETGG